MTAALISRSDLFCAAFDDRGDEAFVDRDRDREVDVAEVVDGVAVEGGVDFRLAQGGDDRAFEDEIVDRDLARVVFFGAGFELGADAHERVGVDLDVEIKMRDRAEAGDEAIGDDFAHAGEADAGGFAGGNFGRGGFGFRSGSFAGRGGGTGCLDVFLDDAATGAGAFEAGEVDAFLSGDLFREGRGFDAAGLGFFFRGRRGSGLFLGRGFFPLGRGGFFSRLGFLFRGGFGFGLLGLVGLAAFAALFFRLAGIGGGGRVLALFADERDAVADVYLPAFLHVNFFQDAVIGRFPFHRRLVGLDFSQDFAGGHFVADFLLPTHERPLGHGVAQFRHLNLRHDGE